jgi:hypothetical protein
MIKLTDHFHFRRSKDNRCWELHEDFSGYGKKNAVKSKSCRYYTTLPAMMDYLVELEAGRHFKESDTALQFIRTYWLISGQVSEVFNNPVLGQGDGVQAHETGGGT